jgi:short-subunit dehydrogenase
LAVPTDVSEADDVERLARMAVAEFGRIDVWVNNAGVAALGRFEEVPLRDHTQVIKTDLLGTIYGSAVALRQFRAQGGGTLINIASVLGEIPAPYYASYVAAKHGVVGLGAALRQEIAKNDEQGIHVCTVLPMAMETPFFENAANYTGHEATPIPPVYDPQDAVKTILRLTEKPEAEVVVGGRQGGHRVPCRRGGRDGEADGHRSPAGADEHATSRAGHEWQPAHALSRDIGVIVRPVSAKHDAANPPGGGRS